MTTLPRAHLPITRLSLPDQVSTVLTVIDKAKSSPSLPTPDTFLASLTTATQALSETEQSIETMKKQLTASIATRTSKQTDFHKACLAFVGHINTLAVGDPAIITSVGLVAQSNTHAAGAAPVAMTAPLNLKATAGAKSCEVRLRWKQVKGAKSYVLQRSADPFTATSFAQLEVLTASKVLLEAQPSNAPLWFRVAAIGASGQGPWTDPVSVVAH